MKIKLDENLGACGAQILRAAGHDVATVPEQGLSGVHDTVLIAKCGDEARCLVTLDHEFGNPLLFPPADYGGIAVLRLPPRPSRELLSQTFRTLVRAMSGADITGQLWVVQLGRVRVYQPDQ